MPLFERICQSHLIWFLLILQIWGLFSIGLLWAVKGPCVCWQAMYCVLKGIYPKSEAAASSSLNTNLIYRQYNWILGNGLVTYDTCNYW